MVEINGSEREAVIYNHQFDRTLNPRIVCADAAIEAGSAVGAFILVAALISCCVGCCWLSRLLGKLYVCVL